MVGKLLAWVALLRLGRAGREHLDDDNGHHAHTFDERYLEPALAQPAPHVLTLGGEGILPRRGTAQAAVRVGQRIGDVSLAEVVHAQALARPPREAEDRHPLTPSDDTRYSPRSAAAPSHWTTLRPQRRIDAIGVNNSVARSRPRIIGVEPAHTLAHLEGLAAEHAVVTSPHGEHRAEPVARHEEWIGRDAAVRGNHPLDVRR